MRTSRMLLLPLFALPLADCALLPSLPQAGPPPTPVESTLPAPAPSHQPPDPAAAAAGEQETLGVALLDDEAYLAASAEVAKGRADASVLLAHLDGSLQESEAAMFERLHAEGLTYSAAPQLVDVRGRLVQRTDEWVHVQLEVCVDGDHVQLGDSGGALGRFEQTVDLVASEQTGWVFIVGRLTNAVAEPICV